MQSDQTLGAHAVRRYTRYGPRSTLKLEFMETLASIGRFADNFTDAILPHFLLREESEGRGRSMAQRLTYRRRHCYATQSNKTRKVKTPGTSLRRPFGLKELWASIVLISQIISCVAGQRALKTKNCSKFGQKEKCLAESLLDDQEHGDKRDVSR